MRNKVIAPSLPQPFASIGIKLLVGIKSLHHLRKARPPDSKRTDPDLHPLLLPLHLMVHPLNQLIDVRSPPRATAQASPRADVSLPGPIVRKLDPCDRIRIEIVV